MRKINVLEFISLDGVIQSPGGPEEDASGGFAHGGWWRSNADPTDPVSSTAMKKQMNMPFDLLLGRTTFDIWAKFWPQHNVMWPAVNTTTKYVASNTITSHEWQPSVFLNGDIAKKITKIKQQEGPDLNVYGSANLVQTLMKHDLVDAFWLKIFPITLGSGKRLFADGTIPAAFKVTESTVTSKGVIIVNYERAGPVTTGSL
jgi:dihydrofolate reductase